jgi:hypothetical protein
MGAVEAQPIYLMVGEEKKCSVDVSIRREQGNWSEKVGFELTKMITTRKVNRK